MILSEETIRARNLKRIAGARDNKVYIGPEIVPVKICNTCNLSCKFCWIHGPGNPSRQAKPFTMKLEKIKEIVRDCVDLEVDSIHIMATGEPSIHPDFREILRYLEDKPIKTKLLTNATFPPEYCQDVIRTDHVLIDLSAVDREHYITVHGKDLFERVVANIKRLVALRDMVKPSFHIEITYIINRLNVDLKDRMLELAAQWGVPIVDYKVMNEHPSNKEFSLPDVYDVSLRPAVNKTPPACLNGWFYLIVSDEVATKCCLIPHMNLGDLGQQSLKEIWLSPRMMKTRFLGKYGYIQKMYSACQACSYYEENLYKTKAMMDSRKNAKATA